jgi:hypothetical protein
MGHVALSEAFCQVKEFHNFCHSKKDCWKKAQIKQNLERKAKQEIMLECDFEEKHGTAHFHLRSERF